MLIFRYLSKEVFVTLVALTSILLLIFMSNQLVLYLNRAASGQIPGVFIVQLMMLELPNLLSLLLPLGFYVALLVAYGRLYAESEMTVLQACGYGPSRLLQHSMIMASVVALLVLVIMLWGSPLIASARATLLRTTGIQTLIKTITPGRFHVLPGGRGIFYVESMNRDHTMAEYIFFANNVINSHQQEQWDLLWASRAFVQSDKKTVEEYVVLEQGHKYQGVPGQADYQVAEFKTYKARLPHPTVSIKEDLRTIPTSELWAVRPMSRAKLAELEWRLSVPLMVLTLTLVGVPLSRVNARSGKYANILPAIILYIIYANFMFIARDWLAVGKTPEWLGMWWIHAVVILIGLLLLWRNHATN